MGRRLAVLTVHLPVAAVGCRDHAWHTDVSADRARRGGLCWWSRVRCTPITRYAQSGDAT